MTLLKKKDEMKDLEIHDPEILERFGGATMPDHPDFEKLAAWRDGKLSAAEREEFRFHVENCEECRDFLLLTSDDEEGEERDPRVADFQKAATWRAVRAEIQAEWAREEAAAARQREIRERRHRHHERGAYAAAGALLVLLLGGWGIHQSQTLSELIKPQMNVAIHDVLETAPRGTDEPASAAAPNVFEVPAGTDLFTLVLPVDDTGFDLYRMRLHDAKGRLVWSGEGLEIDRFGVATLGLSRHFLAAGLYRLDVEGRLEDGDYETVSSSMLDVRYP